MSHVCGPSADARIHGADISTDNESDIAVGCVLSIKSVSPVSESDITHIINTVWYTETHHDMDSLTHHMTTSYESMMFHQMFIL